MSLEDTGLTNVYSNRVLINNWYESAMLDEYNYNQCLEDMKKGKLLLARFRKMSENLNREVQPTQATVSFNFGDKIVLFAPYTPSTEPAQEDKKGLLLGGRIHANNISYSQELCDGCQIVGLTLLEPLTARSLFVVMSTDYCDRTDEPVKYNQEFMLALHSSMETKPLYMRFDNDPIPGLNGGVFPLYYSENPVTNCRWRILPVQKPNITRFEQEGLLVPVNTDIIINHCSTNLNLGFKIGCWSLGFHGKVCSPQMKTCLDIYNRDEPNTIWQIHVPIRD